jgi:zinc D-Ala-D-Ala carboxypeptidase
MSLSPHFSTHEATRSQTAARNGIDNTPPDNILASMRKAALGMELVRIELNQNRIDVSSWFRSEALEKVICREAYRAWCIRKGKQVTPASWAEYFAKKAHPRGFAVDFTCHTYGNPDAIVRKLLASKVPFQQIIHEYDSWVHIAFDGTDRKALIIDKNGPRPFV